MENKNESMEMVMLCPMLLEQVILTSHSAFVVFTLKGGDKRLIFTLLLTPHFTTYISTLTHTKVFTSLNF